MPFNEPSCRDRGARSDGNRVQRNRMSFLCIAGPSTRARIARAQFFINFAVFFHRDALTSAG